MALASYANHQRYAKGVLKKFRRQPPSCTIELYSEHWRFSGQDGVLEYDGPMRPFLESLRSQIIPLGLFSTFLDYDSSDFPIYDGNLIVQIHDYRRSNASLHSDPSRSTSPSLPNFLSGNPYPNNNASSVGRGNEGSDRLGSTYSSRNTFHAQRPPPKPRDSSQFRLQTQNPSQQQQQQQQQLHSGPTTPLPSDAQPDYQMYRVILRPDGQSIWEQICHMNRKNQLVNGAEEWDDEGMLALEARILAATAPALMLDPSSILPTRVANLAINLTYPAPEFISSQGEYLDPEHPMRSSYQYGLSPDLDGIPDSASSASEAGDDHDDLTSNLKLEDEGKSRGRNRGITNKDKKREEWLNGHGLNEKDLDAFCNGRDDGQGVSQEHAFETTSWLHRTWKYNQMRNPSLPPTENTLFMPNDVPSGNMAAAMQAAMANMAHASREREGSGSFHNGVSGFQGQNQGQGQGQGQGQSMDGLPMDGENGTSSYVGKKSKKKKKKDVIDLDGDIQMDLGSNGNGGFSVGREGSVMSPATVNGAGAGGGSSNIPSTATLTTASGSIEYSKPKAKKKSKKERTAIKAAQEEAARLAAEGIDLTGTAGGGGGSNHGPGQGQGQGGMQNMNNAQQQSRKRAAEEMNDYNHPMDIDASNPPASAVSTTTRPDISSLPEINPATGKKWTKKQKEAMLKAHDGISSALDPVEPPKKRVKKVVVAAAGNGVVVGNGKKDEVESLGRGQGQGRAGSNQSFGGMHQPLQQNGGGQQQQQQQQQQQSQGYQVYQDQSGNQRQQSQQQQQQQQPFMSIGSGSVQDFGLGYGAGPGLNIKSANPNMNINANPNDNNANINPNHRMPPMDLPIQVQPPNMNPDGFRPLGNVSRHPGQSRAPPGAM